MSNTKNEILETVVLFERLAEDSNDIAVVRGCYKLIRQIEELVQLMPERRAKTSAGPGTNEAPEAIPKGKPGRKKESTVKKSSEGIQNIGKRRGRKPKNVEVIIEPTNTAE